jgi:hypothetical protein
LCSRRRDRVGADDEGEWEDEPRENDDDEPREKVDGERTRGGGGAV